MKKTFLVLAALFILCFGVHAAEPSFDIGYNPETNKVELTGNSVAGEYVTLEVYRVKNHLDADGKFSLDKAKSDLRAADYEMSVLVFASQIKVSENGTYAFDIKMTNLRNDTDGTLLDEALSEIYAFVIKSGKEAPVVKEYLYIDPAEQAQDFESIGQMSQTEKTVVIQYLKDHKYSLGAYVDILDALDQTGAYDTMYNALVEKGFDVTDKSAATAYLQEAIVMEALNQKALDNIEDYQNELKFTTGELKDWYAKPFVDTDVKAKLTRRLEGQGFGSLSGFELAAKKALVLEFVAENDGLQYVTDIFAEFDEDIWGKDYTFNTQAVRNSLGVNYTTVDDLLEAILSYSVPSTGTPVSPGNSGSSGSFGSSGGGGKMNLGGLTGTSSNTTPSVTPPPVTPGAQDKFSDIDTAVWAKDAIDYMTEKGIVSGRGDGTFAPNDNITRAEYVKILVNAFELTEKSEELTFGDVSADDWYYDFISIAFKNGLARGMSDDFFGANENITRQDMAVMLYNAAKAAGKLNESSESKAFSDEGDIADYAKDAVNIFASGGIISGTGDGNFAPRAFATRAQVVQIVYNLLTK